MWNVYKYRSEFESEEHWALREKFMNMYKHQIPEDRLVALASVFANMEILGCRYPEKTMRLIAEMSRGICDEFRETRKGRLQRTLVLASEAVAQDIRGLPYGLETQHEIHETAEENIADTPGIDFRRFILYKNVNSMGEEKTCPMDILIHSADKNVNLDAVEFHFPVKKNILPETERYCEVKINGNVLSSGTGITVKIAKINAAAVALSILSTFCYTIKVKSVFSCPNCSPQEWRHVRHPLHVVAVTKDQLTKVTEMSLPVNNIGTRMMQRMGWSGSGLGKNQQGIQSPVKVTPKLAHRAGLGCADKVADNARLIFSDYVVSSSDGYIVFCCDSTSSAEMKKLLKISESLKLKTQTFVKDDRIHVVASKKIELPLILEDLLACGGQNDQYLLIHPSRGDQGRSTDETEKFIADLFETKEPSETFSGEENIPENIPHTKGKKSRRKLRKQLKKTVKSAENNYSKPDVPVANEVAEQYRFYNRVQKDKESISIFMQVLRCLTLNCNFTCPGCKTSTVYLHLRTQLIHGLRSAEIRERLLQESELTLQRAMDIALAMESPKEASSEIEEQTKFYNRLQQDGESISTFILDLRSLTRHCNFICSCCKVSNVDLHLRTQFIRGLRSAEIRESLLQESELTFQKAMDIALAMEAPKQEDLGQTKKTNEKNEGGNPVKEESQLLPNPGKLKLLPNKICTAPVEDFRGFIMFMSCGMGDCHPINILRNSAKLNTELRKLELLPSLLNSVDRSCEIRLNHKVLVSVTAKYISKKQVKILAATEAVKLLRKTCYTIKEKVPFFSSTPPIGKDQLGKIEVEEYMEVDPDEIPVQKPYLKNQNKTAQANFQCLQRKLHIPFKKILSDYVDSDTFEDLVFTDEFDNDERRVLHLLAESFSLKTKSHGKGPKRHLVISKSMSLPFLLDILLANGGKNGKYLVLPPTG